MNTRSLQLHPDAPSRSRSTFPVLFLLLIAALILMPQELRSQHLTAVTRPSPEHRVLLMWGGDTSGSAVIGYNVYRKPGAAATYPTTPLNAARIAPITDTTAFKAIIPRFSDDWNTIAYALADTTGTDGRLEPMANVFAIATFSAGSERWRRVQILALARPAIAQVMGQAFNDLSVVNGTLYNYRLVRIGPGGTALPLTAGSDATITAGTPAPLPLPANVRVVVGDAKIQVLWDKPSAPFFAFTVVRAAIAPGPYRKINDTEISGDLTHDLDSNAVSPVAHGFTDYERWDSAGFPAPRTVSGNPFPFTGPRNGTSYWYRVQLKDILGNAGPLSSPVSGMPVDRTPPAVPGNITVDAIEANSSFRIRWSKVQLDVDGHRESRVSYRVYRYVTGLHPDSGAVNVPPVIIAPLVNDSIVFTAFDSTTGLRSACLDSTLFYRVEARDSMGNISHRSIAVGAALKDITPPAIVKGTAAEGFDDFIRVKWDLNTDCGVEQYLIYRSLCDRGDWIPCKTFTDQNGVVHDVSTDRKRDCGGPFALIGSISATDALALGPTPYIDDHSVPPGSPLCYAYLIKAQDHAQNISGRLPIPQNTEIIVCEHLRDRTPPEPAIIAGLMARDSAIQVDFIGQPVQDIAAYHVYRAESRTGPFAWVGGVTVVPPPGTGVRLSSPWLAPSTVGCLTIPLASNPYMSIGSWTDSSADRKRIYWYKVLGVDQSGNQSPPDSALTVSTFTFASNRDMPPKILGVMPADDPCGLTVVWTPGFDTTKVKGFFVFRSSSVNGQYYQLEGLQRTNTFRDVSVARNTDYFYRVVALRRDGMLTRLSDPKTGKHP
jgi:hypothetical protein